MKKHILKKRVEGKPGSIESGMTGCEIRLAALKSRRERLEVNEEEEEKLKWRSWSE